MPSDAQEVTSRSPQAPPSRRVKESESEIHQLQQPRLHLFGNKPAHHVPERTIWNKVNCGRVWWHTPGIPHFGGGIQKLPQVHSAFKASKSYWRLCLERRRWGWGSVVINIRYLEDTKYLLSLGFFLDVSLLLPEIWYLREPQILLLEAA